MVLRGQGYLGLGLRLHTFAPALCNPVSDTLFFIPGCLAEQWSGKKGDTAALGGKKSKKKSSKAKASGSGGSQQRKELGDPNPEEEEGIQKASPLTHSPLDEL